MRNIICKKCGAAIDADLGICPNCGAVYYILSDVDASEKRQNEITGDEFGEILRQPDNIRGPRLTDDADLFSTRVIKPGSGLDETQVFRNVPRTAQRTAARPIPQRSVTKRPVDAGGTARAGSSPAAVGKRGMELRKRQLIVAAVALLALLTLVISVMSGLFDFGSRDDNNNTMPPVLGQTEETAVTILKAMGLEVETMLERNEAVAGTVIKQSIKEGKKVKKGDLVILTISKGMEDEQPEEIEYAEVPHVIGGTYEQALKLLTEQGLVTTRAADVFSSVEAGKVVSQSPLGGVKLQKGDIVTVTVSKGEEPLPSPEGHTVTVTAGKGGSISPKGLVIVADGEDQSFTIIPDEGYEIREVKVDGTSIGAPISYTFTKVTGDHAIYAVFQPKKEPTPEPTPTPPAPTVAPEEQPTAGDNNAPA